MTFWLVVKDLAGMSSSVRFQRTHRRNATAIANGIVKMISVRPKEGIGSLHSDFGSAGETGLRI
jgi:hypothetical protein